eukprot:gene8403-9884_t
MKRSKICHIVFIAVGLLLIAGGIIVWHVVNDAIHKQMEDASIALPENDKNENINPWTRFVSNIGDENNQRTYTFYAYNLTNPDEFLQGAYPIYQELGPYNYWKMYKMLNVTLNEDKSKVSYQDWSYYLDKDTLDEGARDARNDKIYHFNMGYFSLVSTLQKESNLPLLLSGGILGKLIAQKTAIATGIIGMSVPGVIQGFIAKAFAGDIPTACGAWTSKTENPALGYFPLPITNAISTTSCAKFFDKDVQYSLTNPLTVGGWLKALSDPTARVEFAKIILPAFSITQDDYAMLLTWVYTFSDKVAVDNAVKMANCPTCTKEDVFYLQFGTKGGIYGNGQSMYPLLPANSLNPGTPEYGIVTNKSIPITVLRNLFNASNPFYLGSPTTLMALAQTTQSVNLPLLQQFLGADMDFNTAQTLVQQFFMGYFGPTFAIPIIQPMIGTNSANIAAGGRSGIIQYHSVQELLFGMSDPILANLIYPGEPLKSATNVVANITEELAGAINPVDVAWTGKSDINLILAPTTFEGKPFVEYASEIPVSGNSAEQLGPYYLAETDNPQVNVFSSEYARTLKMEKEFSGALKGLPFHRYRPSDANWLPNEEYQMTIPYLMNMATALGKLVQISRPRLKGVPAGYLSKCGLDNFAYTTDDQDVFGDYEPRTGKAIRGRYSVQVNAHVQGPDRGVSPMFDLFFKNNITADVVHPIFWGKNEVVAKDSQIDTINYAYRIDALRYALTIGLIVVGSYMFLGSIGLMMFDKFKEKIL